jgi:4-hydroxy-3-polyprenylbenzoate decarboxylase
MTAPRRDIALLVSGASGMLLPIRFAEIALRNAAVDTLHLVISGPALKVLAHELGDQCRTSRQFVERLDLSDDLRERIRPWSDADLAAPISSGSRPLAGVAVLPCSSGTAGAIAQGISRGLVQRAADVALKQRWPLVLGIREAPMSAILLENLARLAALGVHVMPPVPAFYLTPEPEKAFATFVDHYCVRVLDLMGIHLDRDDLRWRD